MAPPKPIKISEPPKLSEPFLVEPLPVVKEMAFLTPPPEATTPRFISLSDFDVKTLEVTPDLNNNLGAKYINLAFPLSMELVPIVHAGDRISAFFKGFFHLLGKLFVEAFQHPPFFGGPLMIFGRYLTSDSKTPGSGEEVIVRLENYQRYFQKRNEMEQRKGEPLTASFQGAVDTTHGHSFYVDEIVTRGTLPYFQGPRTVRVTTTAYTENLTDPLRPPLVAPSSEKEVKGYYMRAGTPGDEAFVLIKTNDRTIVEEVHQQVAVEYQRTGSAVEAADWLNRSPWNPDLFEIPQSERVFAPWMFFGPPSEVFWGESLGTRLAALSFLHAKPPPVLTNLLSEARPDLAEKMRQVKTEHLPPPVAELVKSLFEVNGVDPYEHAGIAIRLGDGTIFRRGGYYGGSITSWEEKKISDNDAFQTARGILMAQAKDAAKTNAALLNKPITLYYYHTHPYRPPTLLTETPIYQHEDGRTYTLTNETDAVADDRYLDHMARQLRAAGFTGEITLEAGAIPTRKGKKDQIYIATYFPPPVPPQEK